MAAITIELEPETERLLRDKAQKDGVSVEAVLQELANRSSHRKLDEIQIEGVPYFDSRPRLSHEEFARRIRALADGPPVPTLPVDFSRADIYDDHD